MKAFRSYFQWDVFIAPRLMRMVFNTMAFFIICGGVLGLTTSLAFSETLPRMVFGSVFSVVMMFSSLFFMRMFAELMMVFFRINDSLHVLHQDFAGLKMEAKIDP